MKFKKLKYEKKKYKNESKKMLKELISVKKEKRVRRRSSINVLNEQ